MTIGGGYLAGLRPAAAAEFAFLLGLPTLGGACVYKLLKNLKHASETGTPNLFDQLGWSSVLIGLAVATVSAALAVKWLVGFLKRRGLTPFAYYRLILCAVMLLMVWRGVVSIEPPDAGTPAEAAAD